MAKVIHWLVWLRVQVVSLNLYAALEFMRRNRHAYTNRQPIRTPRVLEIYDTLILRA